MKNPSEAIEFYKTVFNARVKDITEYSDGNDFLQLTRIGNLSEEESSRRVTEWAKSFSGE